MNNCAAKNRKMFAQTDQDVRFRAIDDGDLGPVCDLNQSVVTLTSPMNTARLKVLSGLRGYHFIATINDQLAAFVLSMTNEAKYTNENFDFFAQHYSSFLYIDRIVVSDSFRGRGLAKAYYQHLITQAIANKLPVICCEYNRMPLNIPSAQFHQSIGFKPIGERRISADKVVTMQVLSIDSVTSK